MFGRDFPRLLDESTESTGSKICNRHLRRDLWSCLCAQTLLERLRIIVVTLIPFEREIFGIRSASGKWWRIVAFILCQWWSTFALFILLCKLLLFWQPKSFRLLELLLLQLLNRLRRVQSLWVLLGVSHERTKRVVAYQFLASISRLIEFCCFLMY